MRERILNRIGGETFSFVMADSGEWREDGGLETKQLYVGSDGSATALISLPIGSRLVQAYRPGHLGYIIMRGELDGEGMRLGAGDFLPAAGKVPGREMAAVMDTVVLARRRPCPWTHRGQSARVRQPGTRWNRVLWRFRSPGVLRKVSRFPCYGWSPAQGQPVTVTNGPRKSV